uniref:Uncharacterized protein n=1 Tax=Branchiostoma floridae TaxID=7739 RepID=C3ZWZ5_BRAFL|eukprot:XP_002586946.1 hypothetical protein BRAFLDRAFT_103606 [Branchiostoma floridae]
MEASLLRMLLPKPLCHSAPVTLTQLDSVRAEMSTKGTQVILEMSSAILERSENSQVDDSTKNLKIWTDQLQFYVEEVSERDLEALLRPWEAETEPEQQPEPEGAAENTTARFVTLDGEQLDEIEGGRVEKTTEKSTRWGVKIFKGACMTVRELPAESRQEREDMYLHPVPEGSLILSACKITCTRCRLRIFDASKGIETHHLLAGTDPVRLNREEITNDNCVERSPVKRAAFASGVQPIALRNLRKAAQPWLTSQETTWGINDGDESLSPHL